MRTGILRVFIFAVFTVILVSCATAPPVIARGGAVSGERLDAVLDGLFNWARKVNATSRSDLAELFVVTVDTTRKNGLDCELVQMRIEGITFAEKLLRKGHITVERKVEILFQDGTKLTSSSVDLEASNVPSEEMESRIYSGLEKAGFLISDETVEEGILKIEVSLP